MSSKLEDRELRPFSMVRNGRQGKEKSGGGGGRRGGAFSVLGRLRRSGGVDVDDGVEKFGFPVSLALSSALAWRRRRRGGSAVIPAEASIVCWLKAFPGFRKRGTVLLSLLAPSRGWRRSQPGGELQLFHYFQMFAATQYLMERMKQVLFPSTQFNGLEIANNHSTPK